MSPQRTCLGCRAKADKTGLVRIVALGDRVVADPAQRLPGRGAYLHPGAECLQQATRRRAFGRALRRSGLQSGLSPADLGPTPGRLGESGGPS